MPITTVVMTHQVKGRQWRPFAMPGSVGFRSLVSTRPVPSNRRDVPAQAMATR
jgi:hypothetical protein